MMIKKGFYILIIQMLDLLSTEAQIFGYFEKRLTVDCRVDNGFAYQPPTW